MSRKYLNGKWCVRCGKATPTPYLKKNINILTAGGKNMSVLDIGCGNGRNSLYMQRIGHRVTACDMAPPGFGVQMVLGQDPLPEGEYDIVLANYILMFLTPSERQQVYKNILERSKKGTTMMIEMYPAKDAYRYDFDSIVSWFTNKGWTKIRKSKTGGGKCILVRN